MNQDVVSFKSQYILKEISKIDSEFTYNITHDTNNEVTGIVWMSSYMRNNFEKFGNYLTIDEMRSSVYITKKFGYIPPVVMNLCKSFVITENHDTYTFLLESLFKMTTSRTKKMCIQCFLMNF